MYRWEEASGAAPGRLLGSCLGMQALCFRTPPALYSALQMRNQVVGPRVALQALLEMILQCLEGEVQSLAWCQPAPFQSPVACQAAALEVSHRTVVLHLLGRTAQRQELLELPLVGAAVQRQAGSRRECQPKPGCHWFSLLTLCCYSSLPATVVPDANLPLAAAVEPVGTLPPSAALEPVGTLPLSAALEPVGGVRLQKAAVPMGPERCR